MGWLVLTAGVCVLFGMYRFTKHWHALPDEWKLYVTDRAEFERRFLNDPEFVKALVDYQEGDDR